MENLVAVGIFLTLAAYLNPSEGIICLTCSGQNERECRLNGFYEECPIGEICSTIVRRQGLNFRIIKRCKQRESCLNEQKQNWDKLNNVDHVCNRNRRDSVCRCCCYADHCNRNERCAAGLEGRRDILSCPQLVEPFANGRSRCSNSNRVGSVCNFHCSSNYQVNPSYSQQITCLPDGKWNKPMPCCSKPCPPNLFIDLVVLRHYKNHELLLRITHTLLPSFLSKVRVGPDSVRLSQPHYDSVIHTPYLGFRETANLTSDELLNLTIVENLDFDIDTSIVNTGAALWHLYRNEFNTEFDRPNARNVILLFTDGTPQDDVATPARALRESGVTIYTYFLKSHEADEYNEKPFQQISGFRDRKRLHNGMTPVIDQLFFDNFCPATCNI